MKLSISECRQFSKSISACPLVFIACATTCGFMTTASAAEFIPLGVPPAHADWARISADGSTVVSRSKGIAISGEVAFRWTAGGGKESLGDISGRGFFSEAFGVSADGNRVVGGSQSDRGDIVREAFLWTNGVGMVGLGDLPGSIFQSEAFDISDDGLVVVGASQSASGREAFLWTNAGGMVGLGDLGGPVFKSEARAVSTDGTVVVGTSTNSSVVDEAFRWTSAGGMIGLGDIAGGIFRSQAYGVSATGDVVVGRGNGPSGFEAFRWTSSGMVGLGDLAGGGFFSLAWDVSANGSVVVGLGSSATGQEAFVWTQANGMERLADILVANGATVPAGWRLTDARGISADGQWIVGWGLNPSDIQEAFVANISVPEPPTAVFSLANYNGDNKTDIGVLLRDAATGINKLYVMDGASGIKIKTVPFESKLARDSTTVPDSTGDLIPEFAVLLEGSLFARVKDIASGAKLGRPTFNANFDPVALLAVGDAGGNVGPDLAVVGRDAATGKVEAQVKDVFSGKKVSRFNFSKAFVPFAAVVVDNIGASAAKEIAVLGIDATGRVQVQVKDARNGKQISKFSFDKSYAPLAFAAVPNSGGKLKYLAVLGRHNSGAIRAQVKRASDGRLIGKIEFNNKFEPKAFFGFADSNGSGSSEITVVGMNASGTVRAQTKEIKDGAAVTKIKFSASYPLVDAIAVNGVAGTGRNEIAVLGQNAAGKFRIQVKDLLNGNLVKNIPVP